MREKYMWLAIIFLLLLTLGQACYIYERNAVAKEISGPPPVQPEIYNKAYAGKVELGGQEVKIRFERKKTK